MENFLDLFTSASLSFLKQADLHSVLLITMLTFLVRRTFWAAFHWLPSFLVWVPLLLSFLLTPYISTAEEVGWGGTYYIRACLFNGAVAVGVWLLVMPQVLKKWPALLKDDPTHTNDLSERDVL